MDVPIMVHAFRARVFAMLAPVLIAGVAGCSADTGVTEADTVNGIKYTARLAVIDHPPPNPAPPQINLIATLSNVSSQTQDRPYPVGCAVRLRLYRPADGFKMYDETRRPCPNETPATISIPAGDSRELASGIRFVSSVLGDSLPYTSYVVRAVVMTEGAARELEVLAGQYTFTNPASVRR